MPLPLAGRTKKNPSQIPTIKETEELKGALADAPKKGVMKSVSFNDNVKVKSVPGKPKSTKRLHWNHKVEKKRHYRTQDLRPEEREAIWYTEADTKIILAMAKVTVKMMMKGELCDDIDYCSRGLEGKTPTGSKQRQKNKLKVRKAVLEAQEFQREDGVVDGDYLGEISRRNSKEVCEQAHEVGLADEYNIQDYLESVTLEHYGDYLPMQPRRMARS